MTQEHCQPLSKKKTLFRDTQKVYPNTSWDGTMHQTQLPASQSNSPFHGEFRKSNTLWDSTSNHQFCTSDYQSCTSNCLPTPAITFLHQQIQATTNSALATTSPAPATAFLHQRSPSWTRRYQQLLILHQQLPLLNQRQLSCISRYQQLPDFAPATTAPEPVTTFLHQQITVLNQLPSSCTRGNQSCTSDHLSNEYQSCTTYPDLLQRSPSGCGDCSPYVFPIYDSP